MGLYLEPYSPIRLKSFSSSVRGGKATIRVELETEDMNELGFELSSLKLLQQKQMAEGKRKPARLALPKPEAQEE